MFESVNYYILSVIKEAKPKDFQLNFLNIQLIFLTTVTVRKTFRYTNSAEESQISSSPRKILTDNKLLQSDPLVGSMLIHQD